MALFGRRLGNRRSRIVLGAATISALAVVAIALAIGLSWGGSGSRATSWTPTEGRKPIRVVNNVHTYTFTQAVKAGVMPSLEKQEQESGLPLCGTKPPTSGKARAAYEKAVARNDGDTCMADPRRVGSITTGDIQSFYALNAVPSGDGTVRYVDSAGWAIVYPRRLHGVAYSTQAGTAFGKEGASFANFRPPPARNTGPSVPPDGVLIDISTTWNHLTGTATLGHDSRFALRLPASFKTRATGSLQSVDLRFRGNGVAYDAALIAGPKAAHTDLEAVERMVASISFPPPGAARAGGGRSRRVVTHALPCSRTYARHGRPVSDTFARSFRAPTAVSRRRCQTPNLSSVRA